MNIDPILRHEIAPENLYCLGKTNYCVKSLLDWFISRQSFIDPMTNEIMGNEQIKHFTQTGVQKNFYPIIQQTYLPHYKIIRILERHRTYNAEMEKMCDLIKVTEDKIVETKEKWEKSRNRKNGNPNKFLQKISKLEEKANKYNFKKVSIEERYAKFLDDISGIRT